MGRGRKQEPEPEMKDDDPTGWLIDSIFAEFLLLNTPQIKYMAMFGYTFIHGSKLFKSFPPMSSTSYKFVSLIMQCTGGGTFVPIFINSIPVPLAQDAYAIAITTSYIIHSYLPIVRDVLELSTIFKAMMIVLYEMQRSYVVVSLTAAAGKAIQPTLFDNIAIFGPIACGSIAGCGGAFLPLNKGLDPIKENGLGQPMISAFLAATFYHIFMNTSLSEGVTDAGKKAHVLITVFFIAYNLSTAFPTLKSPPTATTTTSASSSSGGNKKQR